MLALSGIDRFSVRKIAAMAQAENARLVEPLLLYCVSEGRVDELLGYAYRQDASESWIAAAKTLDGVDLERLALSGQSSAAIPREYAKHLDSFAVDYHRQDSIAESKKLRLERCRDLRLRTGASVAEISRALGLDAGNVCAFLTSGDLGRVTLEDATRMMKLLMAL